MAGCGKLTPLIPEQTSRFSYGADQESVNGAAPGDATAGRPAGTPARVPPAAKVSASGNTNESASFDSAPSGPVLRVIRFLLISAPYPVEPRLGPAALQVVIRPDRGLPPLYRGIVSFM